MMLVIQTQNYENYGAHDWDGTGVCPTHWKAKGGSEYKITNIPANVDLEEIVSMVRSQIEQDNVYFQATIIGYGTQPDDYLSWFEKSQLEYDGEIQFKEPEIEYSEINGEFA
jgi:hypothetical protein